MAGQPEPGLEQGDKFQSITVRKRWLTAIIVLVSLILVGILAYTINSSSGLITQQEPPSKEAFIRIIEPVQGADLDLIWAVHVHGHAGGLIDSKVVIQVLDAAGNVLVQQPAAIEAPDAGEAGTGFWSVDLRFQVEPGTQGQIVAFSSSPEDGSIAAVDRINVGFGESYGDDELVTLEDHLWKLQFLQGQPLIDETPLTLQFSNLQASGSGGCNRFNTSFERQGENLNFGFVTSTAKECEQPQGIMIQEAAYFDALEDVKEYQIESRQLKMYTLSGDAALVYEAVVMGTILSADELDISKDLEVNISLLDRNLNGSEAQLIAEQILNGLSGFPIPFVLAYNPREIVDNHSYSIEVKIENMEGEVLFTNPGVHLVLSGGHPSWREVIVDHVQ